MALFVIGVSLVSMVSQGGELITVNPNVQYNISGQDDLKLIRHHFSQASLEGTILGVSWSKLGSIGVSKTRLINVESQNSVRIDAKTKKLQYDFSNLLNGLGNCKGFGLIPHIIVGQVPQISLALGKTNRGYYGIRNWAAYENYAYALLEFVTVTKGFENADFEVANEADISGIWLNKDILPKGDPKTYTAYLKLYGIWANAANKLALKYPKLKFRIGGPSITPYSYAYGTVKWPEQFLKDVVTQRLRLDFFSFHFYGDQQSLSGVTKFSEYPSIDDQIDYLRNVSKSAGLSNLHFYVTEWGASAVTDESPRGIINGNHVGAAWAARYLFSMAENNVEEGSLLVFRDYWRPNYQINNWGWPSHLLSDGVTPKALYNVALMFSKLPGQRVSASPTLLRSIGIIASADASKVGILAFNQNWDFANAKELATTENVSVRISGLPFNATNVQVRRYLVDQAHNTFNLYQNRVKLTPENTALQVVNDQILPVINGAVLLPNVDLAPSSVTLWELTPI